jgi:SDR family mycofactocin-dependent oxidoreductase
VPGRMAGKVALITGAARGQGRSHAVRLAQEGADVIAVDLCAQVETVPYPMATPADLDQTVALAERYDRRVLAVQADVRDPGAMGQAVTTGVAELGHLDAVVANAGIAPLGDRGVQAFFDVVMINLSGVINTINAALPHLSAGASVIATGSVAGLLSNTAGPANGPGGAGYSWSKRQVADLVHALALQLGPLGIRVNAVHPTNVNTDMLHNPMMYKVFRPDLDEPTREDTEPAFRTMQAMPIPAVEAEDISAAVLFLASDESRYVTGQQLAVDGGCLVRNPFRPA